MKTVKLLVLSTLAMFSCGLNGVFSSAPYGVYTDGKDHSSATLACQGHGFQRLARIKNTIQLNQTKSVVNFSLPMKYWTDLRLKDGLDYVWSDDSKPRRDQEFYRILNESEASKVGFTYCFLLTNRKQLEFADCTDNHSYICENFQGVPTTLTTQVQPTTTVSISNLTVVASGTMDIQRTTTTTIVTNKATIVPTKTLSTATHSSGIPPTARMTPEKLIQEYFTKMKELNVVEKDSLQIAVNATSSLLTRFRKNWFSKTAVNLLSVVQQLERFAVNYTMVHLNTSSNSIRTTITTAFVITVQKLNAGHRSDVTFPSDDIGKLPSDDWKEKIVLPAELFEKGDPVMVGIVYTFLHELLPDESHALLDGKKLKSIKLGTRIIACSVVPRPLSVLQRNVTVSFTLEESAKAEDTPYCVFWDFQERSRFNGSWSTRGCSLVNKTNTKVVCTCNHLTNFAILMQTGEIKTPTKPQVALEVITYIGCGLSLLGELLTVITYLVLMNLKQQQYQIRFNLVVSIAIAQIIFLAGIDATARQVACIFVAVSIHYFYLAGFAWMLMEGIYFYLKVVKVFNTIVKMKLLYAFSWGFPCLMVLISLLIASQTEEGVMSYLQSNFCWISFSNNLVWTFVVPDLAVCLINSVILCRVVYEIKKMKTAKDVSNIKQGLKACVVLFPLLGMTWVFGVLSVSDVGLAFQYIFTILNSLQGFFIFVMHVLRNSDVRAAYLRKKEKWQSTKNNNFRNSREQLKMEIFTS